VLLDVKNADISMFKSGNARLMKSIGFQRQWKEAYQKDNGLLPLPGDFKGADFRCTDKRIIKMFAYDIQSTDIYNLAYNI
jgi:hypothetical protein